MTSLRESGLKGRAAEGLTIVVSILLALFAEAAWSYRGDRAEEADLLDRLAVEFEAAAVEVANDMDHRAGMIARTVYVSEARSGGVAMPADSVPAVVSALIDWRFYTPGHAVLEDLLSSGNLGLIRSDETRRALMAYVQELERIPVFDALERDFVAERIEPFLARHLALDRLWQDGDSVQRRVEAERFLRLIENDEFGSLVRIKEERTSGARSFSGVIERRIGDVLVALGRERPPESD